MAKTIKVERLLEMANTMFKDSPDESVKEREAVASFLTSILHETGNYNGFNYLQTYGSPGSDPSRVFFYKSPKL